MKNRSVIPFPHSPDRDVSKEKGRVLRFVLPADRRRRLSRIAVSATLMTRIHYPAFVAASVGDVVSSQTSSHAFDAVYRNTMAFLEKVNEEEVFQ